MAFEQAQRRTNPSPYDQVIMLSQEMINSSFRSMWEQESYDARMKKFSRNGANGQYIRNAILEPPQIWIPVTDRNYLGSIYLRLKVITGNIFLHTSLQSTTPNRIPMDGWDLYFRMRVRFMNSQAGDAKLAPYINQSGFGFSNAVFELAKLYLDVSDMSNPEASFDEQKSNFQSQAQTLTPTARTNLRAFMREWVLTTASPTSNVNVLGYALLNQQPSSDYTNAPSLVPRAIDYYVYPWRGESGTSPERDGAKENALALLIITGTNQLPVPPGIGYSGPFTQREATLCISNKSFWDNWILNYFSRVNSDTQLTPDRPVLSLGGRLNGRNNVWKVESKYHFGPTVPRNDFSGFAFKHEERNGKSHWTWAGKKLESASNIYRIPTHTAGERPYPLVINQSSQSWTDLALDDNQENLFSISGKNVFYHALLWNLDKKYSQWTEVTSTWKLSFKLQAVQDGGLEIVALPGMNIAATERHHAFIRTNAEPLRNMAADIKKKQEVYLTRAIRALTGNLNQILRAQNKFVLPGAGVFRMTHPKFNNRGDILVELAYQNVTGPRVANVFSSQSRVSQSESETLDTPEYPLSNFDTSEVSDGHDGFELGEHYHSGDLQHHVDIDAIHGNVDDEDDLGPPPSGPTDYIPEGHGEIEFREAPIYNHTERPWKEEGDDDLPGENNDNGGKNNGGNNNGGNNNGGNNNGGNGGRNNGGHDDDDDYGPPPPGPTDYIPERY